MPRIEVATNALAAAMLMMCSAPAQAATQDRPGPVQDPGTSRAVVKGGEVIIFEPARPSNVRKSFSGMCRGDRYEISVYVGRSLPEAIRSLRVNDRDLGAAAARAIAAGLPVEGRVLEANIAECGKDAARVRFIVPEPGKGRDLHSFDLWVHRNGEVEFVGEQ